MTRLAQHIPIPVCVLTAAYSLLLCNGQAAGLIKADFTPVHLVKQSTLILELRVDSVKDGLATLTVKRAIKGKADAPKLVLDLKGAALADQAADFQKKLAAIGQGPVLLLATEVPGGDGKQVKAFLHVEGTWTVFYQAKPSLLRFDSVDTKMLGTWNGGTDMLARAVDYILADDVADVPVAEGACWSADGARKFGTAAGKVHDAFAVRLSEAGKPALYVASEGGDRLFEYDAAGKELKDVTAARGLTAKSVAAAWGDFNADGRLDLLSWDGQSLSCHTQDAKGAFHAAKVPVAAKVLGLAAVGLRQRSGAIITAAAGPPLLWSGGAGEPVPLPWDAAAAGGLGSPGPAIVADLDGDGLCDILLPFAKGSLLCKGTGQGKFAPPRPCSLAMGAEPARPLLGDLDGDGLLDIVLPSAKGCGVWHNRGGLQFVETLALCGELAYKAGSDVACGQACDFNRDGRQDLLLLSSSTFPSLFFSRGFRCFGYAEGMSLEKAALMPAAQEGQQAGCIADLRADGSQELILVQANGECWVLPFDTAALAPSVRVAVALRAGPVAVTAWHKARCLGAWHLTGGADAAAIASGHPGPILLKWRSADGTQHEKTVTATNKPAAIVLEP